LLSLTLDILQYASLIIKQKRKGIIVRGTLLRA
jgi:hypothetical protein